MKSLKVVFFGTPDFAKTCLQKIHQSHHEIAGVVTVPDKLSGRGRKLHSSPVKDFAMQQKLPLFQPEKLRDPDFLKNMRNLQADVFVVVAFRMMPKILFEIPPMGTFNLHASLLPDYRGAAPINYAIINGEKNTGVTTFFINEKIDEGHILLQEKIAILPHENAGSLHDKLMEAGAELVVQTLNGLADKTITEKPQPIVENAKNAFKIQKNDTRINWKQNSETVYNFIRGLSPYPAAFTVLKIDGEEKVLKIYEGNYVISGDLKAAGTLSRERNRLRIFTTDGIYEPTEVQLEGKKRMSVKDFLNGFQHFDGIELVEFSNES